EQAILFQNRRGYAPYLICEECGHVPECNNCDVSLTYHKFSNLLKCHYCGNSKPMPTSCTACGSTRVTLKGFGTEQIEEELSLLFPKLKVARMDADTTRTKNAYQNLITDFEEGNIDVLVGTQMVTKGLDFDNVSVVGIMNADNMLNFPDFRAHERSFQLLTQVAGRAGRSGKRGRVIIQTYNPFHKILQQVTTNDYMEMYKEQLDERYAHNYPPISRLVRITLKHKDFLKVSTSADWLYRSLYNSFGSMVLGPSSPAVSRIRNQHIKTLLIKLPKDKPLKHSKLIIQKIRNSFQSIPDFRAVRFNVDVDCY
ncbi:MAG: primosomal protein N', partial [Flavobacteriaceae bacterium]|nr:primosomal protein N' [Flavobacteriaceae bacterium]